MLNDMNSTELFCNYYKQWIDVYKKRCNKRCNFGEISDDP